MSRRPAAEDKDMVLVAKMPRVPTTKEVVQGATVNIVLKADQPTGRTVPGIIDQVLTRGNHPRGIKVRLADGRVGRVQSMASGAILTDESAPASNVESEPAAAAESYDLGLRARDRQNNGDGRLPSREIGLDAYVTYAKPRGDRRGKGARGSASAVPSTSSSAGLDDAVPEGDVLVGHQDFHSEAVTCPVCGTFSGDEAAVNHHVASHFDT